MRKRPHTMEGRDEASKAVCAWLSADVCEYSLGKTHRGRELGNAEELLGFGTKENHCRLRDPKTENVPKRHRNNS